MIIRWTGKNCIHFSSDEKSQSNSKVGNGYDEKSIVADGIFIIGM
jgi:hypothetical protein